LNKGFIVDKVVFTNGCFDILHQGHVRYLYQAKERYGGRLVVAINSDDQIRKAKGKDRPYLDEKSRAMILAALSFVDYVTIFKGETPIPLLKRFQPDVLVKGGDYGIDGVVGKDVVEEYGGEVAVMDCVEGFSSSRIAESIRNSPNK
jgi:D-beta-D-heptose 7-phosphate kinase/D-beta-D-heptose 1-phosphate adenosyltransferase